MGEIDVLKEIELFSKLEEDSLQKLAEISETKEYDEGDWIFREDQEGDHIYVVLSGRVRITKSISPGVEKILVMVGEGSFFGELALVSPASRSAGAICEENCKLLELSKEDFEQFVREFPQAGIEILSSFAHILADRLRITTESYKESILWGMKVSGASQLNFDTLIQENKEIGITMHNGDFLQGRLLKVDTSIGGCEITLMDSEGNLSVVPYGAVSVFKLPQDSLKTQNI